MRPLTLVIFGLLALCWGRPVQAQVEGSWTPTGAMASPRESGVQLLLTTKAVLAAGGYDNTGSVLAAAETYNPAKGTWSPTGSMATARANFAAVVLRNGTVLVAGGVGAGNTVLGTAELYNPQTGAWTEAGTLAVPRFAHSATLLANGTVLVTGGCTVSGCTTLTPVSEIYTPSTNSWRVTGSLNTPRAFQSALRLKTGAVLVIGGYDGGVTCELFSPSSGSWSYAASTNAARYLNTATLLPDGKVLATGGANGKYPQNSAELYDPVANLWTPTGAMTAPRYAHSATLLPDGTVMLAGGYSQAISCGRGCTGYLPVGSTELFSEATNGFTAASPLNRALAYQAATLLQTGQALIAGGTGLTATCCVVVSDAEYYTPLTLRFSAQSLNFGLLQVGLTSPAQMVTVSNVSAHASVLRSIAASGDFAQTNTCPATLAPGQGCTIAISFAPTAAGARSGAVTLTDNDPGSPHQTIALTGTGEALALGFTPSSLGFGTVSVGSSATQSATLTNAGAAAVSISGISVTPGNGIFSQTNDCPPSLAVQQSCTLQISFRPPDVLSYKATISVTNGAGAPATLAANGTGGDAP